jgi:hypothetical protein
MNIQTVSFTDADFISPPEVVATTAAFFGGSIDLDPASSQSANSIVQADRFFTWRENGLIQPWKADKVYLYPPRSVLSGDEQPKNIKLFEKSLRFKKSAQRVWLELCYQKWLRNELEQAIIFLTSTEVALLVTQKIGFDFPLCVLAEKPTLIREQDLSAIKSKVFGFLYYLPPQLNYEVSVKQFIEHYSNLGRVYV